MIPHNVLGQDTAFHDGVEEKDLINGINSSYNKIAGNNYIFFIFHFLIPEYFGENHIRYSVCNRITDWFLLFFLPKANVIYFCFLLKLYLIPAEI